MERLKLLIIEDDADQRELIRETLEDHFGRGTVVGVESRGEALAQDLAAFDLILSDYNLPDGTGMDLLEEIRAPLHDAGDHGDRRKRRPHRGRGDPQGRDRLRREGRRLPLHHPAGGREEPDRRQDQARERTLRRSSSGAAKCATRTRSSKQSLKRVEEMAATDPLTGLYNRRHFSRVLDQLFAEAQRYDKDLACVMIDLDGYKQLNDSYGHQVGDQLLVLAGKVITANMRRMDVAARYGGDEFVLLLPHAGGRGSRRRSPSVSAKSSAGVGGLLRRNEGRDDVDRHRLASAATTPASADQLVAAADAALYKAKAAGRNRIVLSLPNGQSETFTTK